VNKDTYVIVPAYNESPVIGAVIRKLQKHYSNIVCVNDGSSDNTADIIKSSGAILINHAINLGQGAATQTGVEYCLMQPNAKYFITFDADDQHLVTDAIKLLACLKKQKLDIVFGSRFLGKTENIPFKKRLMLKCAVHFSNWISGTKLTDTHIGLRVFNRVFAETLNLTMNDMTHASEIINRIKQYNYSYSEVPIDVIYSDYSKSKGQPIINSVNIASDMIMKKITKW
jgi:glycosyltransferase involved in cell wall biosynthesis